MTRAFNFMHNGGAVLHILLVFESLPIIQRIYAGGEMFYDITRRSEDFADIKD